MSTYTVVMVAPNPRQWESKHGAQMVSYRMTLKNHQGREMGNVEWSRKADSPAPTIGQRLDGTVEIREQYGPKFTPEPTMKTGGGWRSKPAEERRSIAMQHAQKCAVSILELAASQGAYKPETATGAASHVCSLADILFQQIMNAEKGS